MSVGRMRSTCTENRYKLRGGLPISNHQLSQLDCRRRQLSFEYLVSLWICLLVYLLHQHAFYGGTVGARRVSFVDMSPSMLIEWKVLSTVYARADWRLRGETGASVKMEPR